MKKMAFSHLIITFITGSSWLLSGFSFGNRCSEEVLGGLGASFEAESGAMRCT